MNTTNRISSLDPAGPFGEAIPASRTALPAIPSLQNSTLVGIPLLSLKPATALACIVRLDPRYLTRTEFLARRLAALQTGNGGIDIDNDDDDGLDLLLDLLSLLCRHFPGTTAGRRGRFHFPHPLESSCALCLGAGHNFRSCQARKVVLFLRQFPDPLLSDGTALSPDACDQMRRFAVTSPVPLERLGSLASEPSIRVPLGFDLLADSTARHGVRELVIVGGQGSIDGHSSFGDSNADTGDISDQDDSCNQHSCDQRIGPRLRYESRRPQLDHLSPEHIQDIAGLLRDSSLDRRNPRTFGLPRFRELAAPRPLAKLKLPYCMMRDVGARELARILQDHHSLVALDIAFNGLSGTGIRDICEALRGSPTLQSLILCGNVGRAAIVMEDHSPAAESLAHTIVSLAALKELGLGWMAWECNDSDLLLAAVAVHGGLDILDWSGNEITTIGAGWLSTILNADIAETSKLPNPEGAPEATDACFSSNVLQALRRTKNTFGTDSTPLGLRDIDLSSISATEEAWKAISNALAFSRSLRVLRCKEARYSCSLYPKSFSSFAGIPHPAAATHIAEGLRINTSIRFLHWGTLADLFTNFKCSPSIARIIHCLWARRCRLYQLRFVQDDSSPTLPDLGSTHSGDRDDRSDDNGSVDPDVSQKLAELAASVNRGVSQLWIKGDLFATATEQLRFFSALSESAQANSNQVLSRLILESCSIADQHVAILSRALTQTALSRSLVLLDLSSNRITSKGCKSIAAALMASQGLQYLVLSNNLIDDGGARSLAKVFCEPNSDGIFNQSLRHLDLSFNPTIGDLGAASLFGSLARQSSYRGLQSLVMDEIPMSAFVLTSLSELLKHNNVLKCLSATRLLDPLLSTGSMPSDTAQALLAASEKNRCLEVFRVDSTHAANSRSGADLHFGRMPQRQRQHLALAPQMRVSWPVFQSIEAVCNQNKVRFERMRALAIRLLNVIRTLVFVDHTQSQPQIHLPGDVVYVIAVKLNLDCNGKPLLNSLQLASVFSYASSRSTLRHCPCPSTSNRAISSAETPASTAEIPASQPDAPVMPSTKSSTLRRQDPHPCDGPALFSGSCCFNDADLCVAPECGSAGQIDRNTWWSRIHVGGPSLDLGGRQDPGLSQFLTQTFCDYIRD